MNKVKAKKQSSKYPALIELTTRKIEVYDKSIYLEMEQAAIYWENAIETDLGLRGWNVDVTLVRCF